MSMRRQAARHEAPPTPWSVQGPASIGAIVPRATNIGAFPSVPDIAEYQSLEARVANLEATLKAQTTEHNSFRSTFQADLTQMVDVQARLGAIDITLANLSSQVKTLLRDKDMHETYELRRESRINTIEGLIQKIDQRLRMHERNTELHDHDDDHTRHEPKGFQQNDQPARFMGRNSNF